MLRSILLAGLLVVFVQGFETQQKLLPVAAAIPTHNEELFSQVRELQKNVTELWTYIHSLRNAVSQHLNHLRQHQVELESTVHRLEHAQGQGGSHAAHTDDHHSHSGEHHGSHSGEHHGSHSGEHHSSSHGDDHQHSHSGEHHSHSGGGGDGDHHHETHSHSHSDDSHHAEGDHQHGDTHESEDLHQSHQGADPMPEPVVVPVQRQSHHHTHPPRPSSTTTTPRPGMQLMTEQGHHHHHSHNVLQPSRNATGPLVSMPKYSDYALYDFAVCNVIPNRAIPEAQQQNVMGQVTLWQKKMGGPLNIHVRLQGFQMGAHHGDHQQVLQAPAAALHQAPLGHHEEEEEAPAAGHKHGFHVHTSGDLSDGCQNTGPHYNPKMVNHGGPDSLVRHVGDLGNIECDEHGITNLAFSDNVASLRGSYSIIGKSMVIHSGPDDYGLGGDEESLRTGNSGTRIACCVIHKMDKIPIRSYKAMKTAIQRKD